MNFAQEESLSNVKAMLSGFENVNGFKVDRLKINRRTGESADFRAIRDFVRARDIEIDFDDQLPINHFVFLNTKSSLPDQPEEAASDLVH